MPPESEKEKNEEGRPIEQPPPPAPHRSHTYEDDLSRAMNATDATVVQELLTTAREREVSEKEYRINTRQRKWYSLFSVVFVIIALGAFGYATYHYYKLTVPVEKGFSVGVFPSTEIVIASTTDIRQTISKLQADITLKEGKPALVPIVVDEQSLVNISKGDFFKFIEATPTEPFVASMEVVRLGIMHDGTIGIPFIILSVPDPQIASKEFLIAEPTLLQIFYRALAIDISAHVAEVGKGFESTYIYNLPVRTLSTAATEIGLQTPVLLYGYATNNIIVVTTKPEVLKAVYDTIIRQR